MAGPARKLLGVDFTLSHSEAKHELGLKVYGSDGRTYKYVRAGAAIALGDSLINDVAEEKYAVTPVAAADTPLAGCWPNEGGRAAILDNYYFWMLVEGDALVKAAATVVAGAPAVPVAVAGTLDDTAATAANALAAASGVGAVFLTTTSGGFARVRFF
jgi:hypothetical protein